MSDLVALARRVLKMSIFSGDRAWAADDLARAVIDLAAKVGRLESALAAQTEASK